MPCPEERDKEKRQEANEEEILFGDRRIRSKEKT